MNQKYLKIGGIVFLAIIGIFVIVASVKTVKSANLHIANEKTVRDGLATGELVLKGEGKAE